MHPDPQVNAGERGCKVAEQQFYRLRDLTTRPAKGKQPERVGRYPVSASTVWRWVARGEFPRPIKLAGGTAAWRVQDVLAWEAERAADDGRSRVERARKAAAARQPRGTSPGCVAL